MTESFKNFRQNAIDTTLADCVSTVNGTMQDMINKQMQNFQNGQLTVDQLNHAIVTRIPDIVFGGASTFAMLLLNDYHEWLLRNYDLKPRV